MEINQVQNPVGSGASTLLQNQQVSEEEVVALSCDLNDDKQSLLEEVLELSRFWECLEHHLLISGKSKANFHILINPDLGFFTHSDSRGTDPELVEHLIDLLVNQNYVRVNVCSTLNEWDFWLENRDIEILADLVGYGFSTPKGHPYDIINLAQDIDSAGLSQELILATPGLSRFWLDADFRINFAKNKTHEVQGYALTLYNLINILPLKDKLYHYHHRLDVSEVCLEILQQVSPHFNLIDAYISNHGFCGTRSKNPIFTSTIIAGSNVLLTDFVGALKMGLDPYISPVNSVALRQVGLPKDYLVKGNLEPYRNWQNIHPITQKSLSARGHSEKLSRLIVPWVQFIDKDLFPFKGILDEQFHTKIISFLMSSEISPVGHFLYAVINFALGFLQQQWDAWEIMSSKENLPRQEHSLGFSPEDFSEADYEVMIDYLKPMRLLLRQVAPSKTKFRWHYLDGSILCEGMQKIAVPYDVFVDRVNISGTIRSMNDYIGGSYHPIKFDDKGRIIHQAERNIYLPQPNWLALFGGQFIDVGKLEVIRYSENQQSLYWRTVTSQNQSADFDDGIVDFIREDDDTVQVAIFTRQKFTLPMFWQVLDINLFPEIKNQIVNHAYATFLSKTFENLKAQYEGKESRIGKVPDKNHHEFQNKDFWREEFTEKAATMFMDILADVFETGISASRSYTVHPSPADVISIDEDGFHHFKPNFPSGTTESINLENLLPVWKPLEGIGVNWEELLQGFITAVHKDLGW